MNSFGRFKYRLTSQVRPGRNAADGVSGVAAQAIVQQLAISDAKAQQDPVDFLLRGGLQGGEDEKLSDIRELSLRRPRHVTHFPDFSPAKRVSSLLAVKLNN